MKKKRMQCISCLCVGLLLAFTGLSSAETFTATEEGQHALKLSSSSKTYSKITVDKTGDAEEDDYHTTGSNAAVFASGKAKLTITGPSIITTNADGGNAVFAYGGNLSGSASGDGTKITISDTTITTEADNSSGIIVTGGGQIEATNLNVTTKGTGSPAISSYNGNGILSVKKGTYTSENSPAAFLDRGSSLTLTDAALTDVDGDYVVLLFFDEGSKGTSNLSMTRGSLTHKANTGEILGAGYVTANIALSGVNITNASDHLLVVYGESEVTLNATDQKLAGDISVIENSTLNMRLSGRSAFAGALNPDNDDGTVKVSVASGSTWTLTGDSYITSVTNNGTIEQGDYTLYVNGVPYDGSASVGDDNLGTAPSITTSSLKDATASNSYSVTLKATGTTPITWEADSLPDGLSLNEATGQLSGTPTIADDYTITFTATNSAGSSSATLDLTVNDVAPKIKGSVKAGLKNVAYSTTFTAISGTGEITWELDGNLPEGLSFDEEAATLGGIPTEVWNDYITITAKNTIETSKRYKLVIKAVKPKITTKSLASGIAGEEYSASIDITGSKTITVAIEGLPDGIDSEFDLDTGELSLTGTPETAGKYSLKIAATNDAGTAKKSIHLVVNSAPDITSQTLDDGTTGKSYSQKLVATGTTPITWALDPDSELPAGLSLTSKGQLKGKPTFFGSTTFTVIATNAYGLDTADITMNVNAVAPVIAPKSLKKGTAGSAYRVELNAKNGTEPITWECEGNLPDGMTFADGVFSGTPTEAFSGTVTITATNAAGDSTSMTYNLVVKAVAPKISTTSLASGTVGKYYDAQLETSAGTEPITWSWSNEPNGLDLDSETGEIYGIPTAAGKYKVKITATNALKSVSKTLTLTIAAATSASSIESNEGEAESLASEPAEPQDPVSGLSLPEGYEIVYELGEIEIDESGMYDMALELEDNAKSGAKLFWLARATSRKPKEDDTIAEFFAPDGEEIREVPADRRIIVSAWLEAGVKYNPVIAVK